MDRTEALLKLQSWLSPAFPVGAFSYSHGLEWAAEAGHVSDGASFALWLEDVLSLGSGRNDAIFISETAKSHADPVRVAEIAELALAMAPSRERYLETSQQGQSFQSTIAAQWPSNPVAPADQLSVIAYPVAFGMAIAEHDIALSDALPAYLNAFASNLVSAAIRLSVIGQGEAQGIIRATLPLIQRIAQEAEAATLDDLSNAAFGVDFASLKHETQYSRLFRS
jgi:urease accessory protein